MIGMANRSGMRLTLGGFPVTVPLDTLLGVVLIAWLWLPTFARQPQGLQILAAVIFAVALLASVLVHEFAHAVAARRFGFPVLGITLWAFGGFTSYRPVRNTPGREAAIAVAGPAASLLLGAAAWLVLQVIPDRTSMLAEIVAAVSLANVLVGVFNLLPGLPLDGGSVLSAGVWAATKSHAKGQRVAGYAGMLLAAFIVGAPLLLMASGGRLDLGLLVVSVLVGGFLFLGARSALQQADAREDLEGRTAADLAMPVIVVPEAMSLLDFDRLLAGNAGQQPVVALVGDPANGLRGVVMPPAAAAVPAEHRAGTTIAAVTRSVPNWASVAAGAPAEYALQVLQGSQAPLVVLNAANQPVGLIVAQPER